jgi:hypothetical protein
VLVLSLLAALAAAAVLAPTVDAQARWRIRLPLEARRTGTFRHPRLLESSGVVASHRYPGVLWTLNDSDNPPEIFATDSAGRDLGVYRVTGARNEDWEAITLGPCETGECLYIADTGDNDEIRPSVRLYRVPEPVVAGRGPRVTARAQALEVRYPDGAHDVEAVVVAPDGAVLLVSKGRSHGVRAFRIPATAWRKRAVVAEALGRLPIASGRGVGAMVTDAALSPGGDRVAIRTYLEIFFFRLTSRDTFEPLGVACDVAGLELQGEGLTWVGDDGFVLTSEGRFGVPGTITAVRCPAE